MIKNMLIPLIKRYRKLFISMILVSALAVIMMVGLISAVNNTYNAYLNFKENYGYADAILYTELSPKRYMNDLAEIDGVENVNERIGINAYLTTQLNKVSTAMLCSYRDDDDYKHYEITKAEHPEGVLCAAVESRYAEYNDIEAGQTVSIYLYGTRLDVFVESIVFTPETIYITANPYLLADNSGFGYVFMSDENLVSAIKQAKKNNFYLLWLDAFNGLTRSGELQYANQVLIQCEKGADAEKVMNACREKLEEKTKVNSATLQQQTSSAAYMEKFHESFGITSKVFPLFFYVIMLFVIVLFLNQMVLYMTTDIGILLALGWLKKEIVKLLSAFALCISAFALILGIIGGKALAVFGSIKFAEVYQLPDVSVSLDWQVVLLASIAALIVGQLAVLIAALNVFKISPKDAMINNDAKKISLPAWLESILDRMTPERKLNVCICIQNPRRLLASVFSVMAAMMMLTVGFNFSMSKSGVMTQVFGQRYAFDVHYLSTGTDSNRIYWELSELDGITRLEKISYAKVNVTGNDGKTMDINICGLYPDTTMFQIPDEKGKVGNVKIEGDGIWLNIDQAEELGVSTGDTVMINEKPVVIRGLTHEYMNKISAMTADQLATVSEEITTGYMMRISDRTALDQYLLWQEEASVISNIDDIEADLAIRLDPLDIIVGLVVVFAVAMSVIVISMMSQAALTEQQRLVSNMRVIGFTVKDISKLWIRQNIFYILAGTLLGLPLGLLSEKLLIKAITNDSWSFPFLCRWDMNLLAVAIITGAIIAAHFVSMRIIRTWNLADNTRSKE